MTLDVTGYTVGSNEPLTHARILWDMMAGAITADGTDGDFAANDYTAQRWTLATGANTWVVESASAVDVDTVFISAHNLSGRTVTISTSPTGVGSYTTRATVVVPDNSTIAVMFNQPSGNAVSAQRVRVSVDEGDGNVVGIIRAGNALQMQHAIYGGFGPLRLNRVTEGQQSFSETGQWLGRTEKRVALRASYSWQNLKADWYRSTFQPFAETLPLQPFGIISNPQSMADDVGWVWASTDPAPLNAGLANLMGVQIDVTGLWE